MIRCTVFIEKWNFAVKTVGANKLKGFDFTEHLKLSCRDRAYKEYKVFHIDGEYPCRIYEIHGRFLYY